jgi:penicillin-binding protein 2
MYHIERLDQRIIRIIIAIIIALCIIGSRLFYLQIRHADHYISRGLKNFQRIEIMQSRRGNIRDCSGALLATNRPVTHVYWQGTGNRSLSPAQLKALEQLETIIGKPIIQDPELFTQICSREKYYKRIKIASDISFEQLSKIEEQLSNHTNLSLVTHFERHYPHGTCASHVLGYLGRHMESESLGQMGLEKLCEQILKGEPGTMIKTINSVGRDIAMVQIKKASAGQKICELVFPENLSGTFLIMDPEDGAVKALVSRPTFDPSLFLAPMSPKMWQELQEQKPFINRALNPYPPGSIFKLATVSAALEKQIIRPNQSWYCPGYVTFAQRKYYCSRQEGHGHLNTVQAVAHSCNIMFFEIGKQIDVDILTDYAHRFGLGTPTNVLFPERTGIVPSREWKLRTHGERWWPGETLSVSIGQSFLMATPMQVARMIGSIFTGFLVKPRILVDEQVEKSPLNIKPDTIRLLRESMRFVVTYGTGQRVNTVKDIQIYAKTSTAQTSDLGNRELGEEYLEHAWFVAYFKYKEERPLVFVILGERAGTSRVPAAIAKQFLIEYKNVIDSRT